MSLALQDGAGAEVQADRPVTAFFYSERNNGKTELLKQASETFGRKSLGR
jgi:hypothetical protein